MRPLVLCCIALLAACGNGNNENGSPNNGNVNSTTTPNNTAGTNNTTTANNTTATSGPNNTTGTTGTNNTTGTTGTNNNTTPNLNNTTPVNNANPGVEVNEAEPNNDDATATAFAPNDTLIGVTSNNDNDFWAIDLVAGSILEVELTTVQLAGEMYVDLVDPAAAVPERTVGGNEGDTRQFFIPTSGRYLLRLTDLTAGFSNYKIATRVLPASPATTYSVPGSLDGDLNDYRVDVFAYRAGTAGAVRAGVTADRSPVLSDMDALMIVYSPSLGLVAVNDDVDANTVDPEVNYDQVAGTTYWIVVDAVYLEPGGDNSYTLASEIQ